MEKEKITIEDIDKLASLSALEFSEEEKYGFLKQVIDIVDMIDECNEVETDGEYIFENAVGLDELREDEIAPSMPKELALSNAPRRHKGCFNVPKVVD